jgi:cytoskeletal protein CcmA (bactofilin family)
MAANTINQLSTANTFQHWLNATELLIATANLLTNGNGEAFYANTRLIVGGSSSNVSLNVQTSATINDLVGNTSNVVTGTFRNLTVTQNVASLNVTGSSYFGQDVVVYGNQQIKGDLEVSGNLSLDSLGFDDLSVAGSGSFGNTLTVTGQTTLSNVTVSGNVATLNVTNQANFGNNVQIDGDLVVSGNITLDSIGFDDLNVSGSANISNNLIVTGTTNLTGNLTVVNANVTSTLVANTFIGPANTQIYNTISQVQSEILAFSIALG